MEEAGVKLEYLLSIENILNPLEMVIAAYSGLHAPGCCALFAVQTEVV